MAKIVITIEDLPNGDLHWQYTREGDEKFSPAIVAALAAKTAYEKLQSLLGFACFDAPQEGGGA